MTMPDAEHQPRLGPRLGPCLGRILPQRSLLHRYASAVALCLSLGSVACMPWGNWHAMSDRPAGDAELRDSPRPPPLVSYRYPDAPPVLDADGLRSFAEAFRRRVVLLDFWSTLSPRSQSELADLAELRAQLGLEELQVIHCNLDGPRRWKTHTVPILQEAGSISPCVVIRREAMPAVRSWLSSDWDYDLPARFLLDRHGRVAARATGDVALASMKHEARRLVAAHVGGIRLSRLPAGAVGLRVKLVDVREGEGDSLPEVRAGSCDGRRLAEEVAELVAGRIRRADNPRIAVLPFRSAEDRPRSRQLGEQTARHLLAALRARGFYDLVSPRRAQGMIDEAGITTLAIDFDPTVARGHLACDFLVIGWLRGNTEGEAAGHETLAAEEAE